MCDATSSVIRLFPPGSRTRIELHARSVLGRWAIISVVRPFISRWSAAKIVASVWTSSELVGSSRMRTGASFRNARASEMRCRSPPDSFMPRSPTWVLYPLGRSCGRVDVLLAVPERHIPEFDPALRASDSPGIPFLRDVGLLIQDLEESFHSRQ